VLNSLSGDTMYLKRSIWTVNLSTLLFLAYCSQEMIDYIASIWK